MAVRSRRSTNTFWVFCRCESGIRDPSFRARFDLELKACFPGTNADCLLGVWSVWSCSRCGRHLWEASDVYYRNFWMDQSNKSDKSVSIGKVGMRKLFILV
jgi:hypothetical protein